MDEKATEKEGKKSRMTSLAALLREHDEAVKQFSYILLFVIAIFAMTFLDINVNTFNFFMFLFVIVAVALIIFLIKRIIASFFEIKLTNKRWITGLIFSMVGTLFLSALGTPILVPILNTQEYARAKTLRGMKKGEVNLHEKWSISIFSSMAFLAFAMLFFGLFNAYKSQPFLDGGVFLTVYTFLNFFPYHKFDGAFLIYHNILIAAVFAILALLTMVLSYINFIAGLSVFILFVVFGFVSYRLKLW
jgi:MFS family permease